MNPLLFDRMLYGVNDYYPKLCVYKERLVYHIASAVRVRNDSRANDCNKWSIITQLAFDLRLIDQLELAGRYVGVGEHRLSFYYLF